MLTFSSSTSTLRKITFGYLLARSAKIGAIARQGPHHEAVKSMTTYKHADNSRVKWWHYKEIWILFAFYKQYYTGQVLLTCKIIPSCCWSEQHDMCALLWDFRRTILESLFSNTTVSNLLTVMKSSVKRSQLNPHLQYYAVLKIEGYLQEAREEYEATQKVPLST